jgi:hypothetical protein
MLLCVVDFKNFSEQSEAVGICTNICNPKIIEVIKVRMMTLI